MDSSSSSPPAKSIIINSNGNNNNVAVVARLQRRSRKANESSSSFSSTVVDDHLRHSELEAANNNISVKSAIGASTAEEVTKLGVNIYKYSRAYVLKGTVLSIISISLLAVQTLNDFTPSFFLGLFQAVIGGCLANLYVVGLNQLSDIEIDKVNKPYLPLASGQLSVKAGIRITSIYAFLGFCLGWIVSSWHLKLCLFIWYAAGTAYSVHLPLLRWKRFPVLVAMCSWSIQGVTLPMLFHLHALTCIHGNGNGISSRPVVLALLSKHAIFVFGIMGIHSTVLVIFKDIPDVEGDKTNGINTFPARFGPKLVFWICICLLQLIYVIGVFIGLLSTHFWIRPIMVSSHGIIGYILWRKANLVDLKNNDAIESFYLFIWKLYYVEYLLVPILRF